MLCSQIHIRKVIHLKILSNSAISAEYACEIFVYRKSIANTTNHLYFKNR